MKTLIVMLLILPSLLYAACSGGAGSGALRYDSGELQVCDGTNWNNLSSKDYVDQQVAAAGGGSSSVPEVMVKGTTTCPSGWTQVYSGNLFLVHLATATTGNSELCINGATSVNGRIIQSSGSVSASTFASSGVTCAVCVRD